MSLGWVLLGTFGQLMLAYLLFMLVVFSACGMATGHAFSPFEQRVLNASMYLVPASCLLSAGIVLCVYWGGGGAATYLWYALPLAVAALYLAFVVRLIRRSSSGDAARQ